MRTKLVGKVIKLITVTVLSAGIMAGTLPVQAEAIKDLSKASAYAKKAVQWMVNNKVISGDQYGYFNPGKKISRVELVTIIVKALNIDITNLPETPTFSDVSAKHWAYAYVEAASRTGIISGIGNGKFGVNSLSTREQVTSMIMNYLSVSKEAVLAEQGLNALTKFIDEENMSEWAKPSIQFAVSNGIMSGTGSNTFSPAGKATKEQIAVILHNFINNSERINQAADSLRKPLISFNGDVIKLTEASVLENGEFLIPVEAFVNMGLSVTVDEAKSRVVVKNSEGDKNIHLGINNKTAYVNYTGTGNPFAESGAAVNAITLAAAPKVSGEAVLVPAKAVTSAMSMTIQLNEKTNLIVIKDASSVNNPALYNAYEKLLDYKREYKSSLEMSMAETSNFEELMGLSYIMEGANNGSKSTSNTKVTTFDPLYGEVSNQYNVIKIGQQIYTKNLKTGIWSTVTEEEALEQGIMYFDYEADKAETQKILDSYEKREIYFAGKALINGEEVNKYEVKADKEILKALIPSDLLGESMTMEDIYNKGFNMKTDVYVNSNGHIIKQVTKINAAMELDGSGMKLNVTHAVDYKNIGAEIEIVSPSIL